MTVNILSLAFVILFIRAATRAQDVKTIQRRIEEERQIEKVKNEIIKNLGSMRPDVLQDTFSKQMDDMNGIKPQTGRQKDPTPALVPTPRPAVTPTPRPMISVGEFMGSKKDGCLIFKIGKYVKDVDQIVPLRMDLWVHIQYRKKNKKKKNKGLSEATIVGRNNSRRVRRASHRRSQRLKKNRKRRKRSRNIKIVVTDGDKRLAKLRMRVKKTIWKKIELPISKFPDVIRPKDSFKLCVVCKRCNKNVKLILFNKTTRVADPAQPRIPFIHIESHPQLPRPSLLYSNHN